MSISSPTEHRKEFLRVEVTCPQAWRCVHPVYGSNIWRNRYIGLLFTSESKKGSNIPHLLWGAYVGIFEEQLTEMIHTHVATQKPYLLWIRDHTLKFLHVFKIHNNITHNIKCDTVQGDTLQVLLGIITYVQRKMKENRQEHHQLQTLMLYNNTLLKLTALTPS